MISYQKIGTYVTAEPFRPFRIQTASGRTFEIRHPEMIAVNLSSNASNAPTFSFVNA